MQRNSEVLNGLVVGHKRDGRCRYDPQVKQELVRQCMMPGVSVARMAMHLGGYSRVTDFFREWRATEGKKPHAFVPLKFDLGEAFQFGWSKEDLVVGGIYRLMQVSHRKLCASRAFWLVAYPARVTRCCLTPTPAPSRRWEALPGVASTTR